MTPHLTPLLISRYQARTLPPEELLAVTRHLAACGECRSLAAPVGAAFRLREALQEEHLSYEALEKLAEGGTEGLDHLSRCPICVNELRDLKALKQEIKKQVYSGWHIRLPAAALALLAGVLIIIGWPKKPVAAPVTPVVLLRDGANSWTLEDASSVPEVAEVLRTGKLPIPAIDVALAGRKEVLLGDKAPVALLQPLAPKATAVASDPVFRWSAPPGSKNFRVAVYDENFDRVALSPVLQTNEWTPATPLPRGKIYSWTITAESPNGKILAPRPPEPEAKFRLTNEAEARELEELRNAAKPSELRIAIVAARLGCKDEALQAIQRLEKMNPNSPIPGQLRTSLEK